MSLEKQCIDDPIVFEETVVPFDALLVFVGAQYFRAVLALFSIDRDIGEHDEAACDLSSFFDSFGIFDNAKH